MLHRVFVSVIVFLSLSVTAFAQEIIFSANASSNKIGIQDRVQVNYTIKNVNDLGGFSRPDFDGFRIAGGPMQSYQNINGRSSVSIIYVLQPARKGTLSIPGAKVSIDGKTYQSNSLQIQVVDGSLTPRRPQRNMQDPYAGADDDPFAQMDQSMQQMMQQQQAIIEEMQRRQRAMMDAYQNQYGSNQQLSPDEINKYLYIKAEVDNTHPYVGQQVNVNYKVYTRVNLNILSGYITKLPSLNGFWSEDYQLQQPMRPSIEYIQGVPYAVTLIKKTAIFPQQSGRLELDPATATCEFPSGKYKISSAPVYINVKPLPTNNQPASFTGAVGNFTVNATLDKTELTTDDVGTFTFTVSGSGNIKLIDNPKINFPAELGAYDPQIIDTVTSRNPTITGKKIFAYSFNPQRPGEYTIPPVAFSYYDAGAEQYKTINTQPFKIKVKEGSHYNDNIAKSGPAHGDIKGIVTGTLRNDTPATPVISKGWYWSMYGLPALAFIGLLAYRKKQEDYVTNAAFYKTKKANKVAWQRLATARKLLTNSGHNDFYEAISKALWLYLSDKLSIPISELSKENIVHKLQANNVSSSLITQTQQLISECEMALYSPSGNRQQRVDTLEQAGDVIGQYEAVLKKA